MQKANRFECWLWSLPQRTLPVPYACLGALLALMLVGCGGEGTSHRQEASAPLVASTMPEKSSGTRAMTADSSALTSRVAAPLATADKSPAVSAEESVRLAKLRALSLLSPLTERERLDLLRQLADASPSARLDLFDGYRALAMLPERQKEVLLNQIEKIVPVTVPASLLVCSCSNGIERKLCIRERCSNHSELGSACNKACGTLASFKSKCLTARQCAGQ